MVEINNKTKNKINLALVKKTMEKFLSAHKKKNFNVSIAFVGDAEMRRLNKIYRRKDKPTDVLSFAGEGNFLGEIIIDYAQIKRQVRQFQPAHQDGNAHTKKFGGQAKLYKNSIQRELVFILVHGLLHLIGHDDKMEKGRREMEELGSKFVKQLLKF